MSEKEPRSEVARRMREEFDRTFAEPPRGAPSELLDLLVVSVRDTQYALRVCQLEGLFADRRIVAAPSPLDELVGVTALRGRILPVFSFALLLGVTAEEGARWIALTTEGVGLAFGQYHEHRRVAAEAIARAIPERTQRRHVLELVRLRDIAIPILDLPSVVEEIKKRIRDCGSPKERRT